MKTNKDILGSLLKTTQMGQTGIRSILKAGPGDQLQKALKDQLSEYNTIEADALRIADNRGWNLPQLPGYAKVMADTMSRAKLIPNRTDSAMAAMMIRGSMRGVIKGLKNDHRYQDRDPGIEALSNRLLDCENENIRQMERFL